MNKTLLLILCDFLLLNLLALTRWEKAEPVRPPGPPVPELPANASTVRQDLADTLRLSLADEQQRSDTLAQELSSRQKELETREQSLQRLEAERQRLAGSLEQSQSRASDLDRKLGAVVREAAARREKLEVQDRELALREAELARQKAALAELEKARAEDKARLERLAVAVEVAQREKALLETAAETLRQQVEVERLEREKVRETTAQLAQGVGQLAEKSGELSRELRDHRPLNANVLFNDFLGNRVEVHLQAERDNGFLGLARRTSQSSSVLVSDGDQIFALFNLDDTPFGTGELALNWLKIDIELKKGGKALPCAELRLLAVDPRVAALPLSSEQAARLGVKVYPLAKDPLRFPEAMLVHRGGAGYGEVPFKLEVSRPSHLRMDNRLFKMLVGDFTPSRGDLVLSRSGEFLGLMVSSGACALVRELTAVHTLHLPDTSTQNTARLLGLVQAKATALGN